MTTMPNTKVLDAAAASLRRSHRLALREYHHYKKEVPTLIRQLGGPTQVAHDRAFRLLSKMADAITDELLAALADPTLDPDAADEVVSLLGRTGDPRAVKPIWAFFQANRRDLERASTAALSLSFLGDERVLPYLRESLKTGDNERVANAATAMIAVGQMEDIPLLRTVHRQFKADTEIRVGVANAILSILGETGQATLEREMDDIQGSLADCDLWSDIWALMEQSFGPDRSLHRRPSPRKR
jgi:HEAT repeat protein